VSKQRLDRAILTFFQHFRRCYAGDQTVYSSKVESWKLFSFEFLNIVKVKSVIFLDCNWGSYIPGYLNFLDSMIMYNYWMLLWERWLLTLNATQR